MSAPLGTRRATLQRRIRLLVGATITYNVIEAVVALAEGTRVSSSALIGFGLDSAIGYTLPLRAEVSVAHGFQERGDTLYYLRFGLAF